MLIFLSHIVCFLSFSSSSFKDYFHQMKIFHVNMNVKGFFMLVFDIIPLLSLICLLSWLTILPVVYRIVVSDVDFKF